MKLLIFLIKGRMIKMSVYDEYNKKLCTPEEAVQLVKDGDWVDYGQTCTFPTALDRALAGRKGDLKDVKVRSAIGNKPVQIVEQDPEQESFTYNVWHYSGLDRKYADKGLAYNEPMLFRNCGSYYTKGYAKVNVAMLTVCPMDKYGNFNFGLSNCCMQEVIDAADIVIVEENESMPFIYGVQTDHVNISQVTKVVKATEPISEVPAAPASEMDRKIADQIFPYLEDGMTVQLGIGGMPNAVGSLIASSDLKNLGMHTELMSDGYLDLYMSGKMNDSAKDTFRGKGIFSICFGSRALYDFLNENQQILSAPMHFVNDPYTLKGLGKFVSINSCICADLYGQVCSESAGTRQISGTGGQLDFVTGAYTNPLGKAFLAMPSARMDKQGNLHSNIIPKFTQGDIITTPRTQAPMMVTEFGVACLPGLTTWQRAEALINIAHPQFRDELIKAAEEQKIWRKSNKR